LCLVCVAIADDQGREAAETTGGHPVGGTLRTRWAKDVTPDAVHPEYPRPQLVRAKWQNLNGLWNCTIRPRETNKNESTDSTWNGEILVPFPVESELSGVRRSVGANHLLIYERSFQIPTTWVEDRSALPRILLHFSAVDWEARVFVNDQEVGLHRGGYHPFTIDITGALGNKPAGQVKHDLRVEVWDPTDAGTQPRGKQVSKPEGIWYTPVTGIWQTVWLEPVPATHIETVHTETRFEQGEFLITVGTGDRQAAEPLSVRLLANGGKWQARGEAGKSIVLKTTGFEPWSPTSPGRDARPRSGSRRPGRGRR